MDFQLNEDQEALRAGVRVWCEDRFRFEKLAEVVQQPLAREWWRELAELGVFALRAPESAGGVGLGMAEAAVAFVELGRRLVPGPLLWNLLAAELIPGAASGEVIVGGLDQPQPADRRRPSATPAQPTDAGAALIEYGDAIDVLLVLRDDGVQRIEAAGQLPGTLVAEPLDPLTPMLRVSELPEGTIIGDAALAARLRLEGTALTSALLLGIAESTLEYAVAYAKQREQFGRAIASFQAIKHFAADMYVRQELARAATLAAAVTIDDPAVGDVSRAVASARVVAGAAARENARKCIQIYGGMGFTWEMPPHYYLKRCMVLENTLGQSPSHCTTVAAHLAAPAS